jgi:Protein of unknown function (DUF3313)
MARGCRVSLGWSAVLLAAAALAAACATTQQVQVSEKVAGESCAFLGNSVCAKLESSTSPGRFSSAAMGGKPGRASLRYVSPEAQWTQYSKVLLQPVTFWAGDDSKVPPEDQHRLVDFFYQALEKDLATHFQLVQHPGAGTMTIQVALLDAESATPGLRTISMVVPQARALSTLKYIATGTYAFVGSATAEVKVVDSMSHEVLGAAVERRVGGGSLQTAAQLQWGDAENAMKAFSQQVTDSLYSWTSGQATP